MAFRRNREESLQWQKWLRTNRATLLECGVPELLLAEMSNWYFFLEHGYFTPLFGTEPIIRVEDMNHEDAERLCTFLENDTLYPAPSVINRLQFLLKRGLHADAASDE